jgi:hypothetical protein
VRAGDLRPADGRIRLGSMTMRCIVDVRGKRSEWGIPADLSREAIEAMREDGLNIIIPENIIPAWVVGAGLLRPWCFLQDLWNFKNPFRQFYK